MCIYEILCMWPFVLRQTRGKEKISFVHVCIIISTISVFVGTKHIRRTWELSEVRSIDETFQVFELTYSSIQLYGDVGKIKRIHTVQSYGIAKLAVKILIFLNKISK